MTHRSTAKKPSAKKSPSPKRRSEGPGSAVKGSAVKGSAVKGSAVKGSAVKGSAVKRSAVKGSAVKGSAVKGSAVKGSAVKGSAVKPPPAAYPRRVAGAFDLAQACAVLEEIAPLRLAQSWDNVGLLAGRLDAPVERIMLCIDLMPAVVEEAIRRGSQLVVAYHPPIFRPITRLVSPGRGMEASVMRCLDQNIAVYSPHTAYDAALGGPNDVLARLCDMVDAVPIERPVEESGDLKLVVFTPASHVERVAEAMHRAGAGTIGGYERCSFRSTGQGTFFGGAGTKPAVGRAERLERASEHRLEVVCPKVRLAEVVDALRGAHPYEEPAFDLYPRREVASLGIGRKGALKAPIGLQRLARKLKRRTGANCVSMVGDPNAEMKHAFVSVGAAGSSMLLPELTPEHVIVTGEIRHHDALHIQRIGCAAIALSHWSSERPVLGPLAVQLKQRLAGVRVRLSGADAEPFVRV